jgi:hypothetical protein
MRLAAAAVLVLLAAAVPVSAQCVSEVKQILPRGTVSSALVARAFAWSGSVLAVATEQEGTGAVWIALFNEHGDRLSLVKLSSPDNAKVEEVVWNGTDFAIFLRTSDNQLAVRRMNTAGELIGPTAVPLRTLVAGPSNQIEVLWSARHNVYFIAHTVNGTEPGVWLAQVAPSLDPRLSTDTFLGRSALNSYVRMAMTNSGVLGVFFEQEVSRDVIMMRVASGDLITDHEVWSRGENLEVDASGNEFVLVQTVLRPDGSRIVRWKMIDTSGFDTEEELRIVGGSTGDARAVGVIARGDEIALTYLDARDGFSSSRPPVLRLRRFTRDGVVLSDTYFAAADATRVRNAVGTDALWTGSAYLTVATLDIATDATYLVRYCPLNATIEAPRLSHTGEVVTYTAIGDGGVPDYQYVWTYGAERINVVGPTLQLQYNVPGTYDVLLTVTDATGTVVTRTFTVNVATKVAPKRRSVKK